MDNVIQGSFGANAHTHSKPCKVAYSVNGTQPVICTFVSDQPFFYFDEEIREEDMIEDMEEQNFDGFDEAEMKIMQAELEALKKEIEAFDEPQPKHNQLTCELTIEFGDNALTLAETNDPFMDDVQTLIKTISQSRTANAYIEATQKYDVEIKFSAGEQTSSYNKDASVITLNNELSYDEQILCLSRELRKHWQHRQGASIDPMTLQPDDAVLINRAQDADCVIAMARIAWELQLAGQRSPWEHIESSSLGDVARSIAREANRDFRNLQNGISEAAAFEAWFLSERCKQTDQTLIHAMLASQQQNTLDMPSSLQGTSHVLVAEILTALGEMPLGENYLVDHIGVIMSDEIFTSVRDRSNANFLWFVKFEQSFQETEQFLQESSQKDGIVPTDDVLSSAETAHNTKNIAKNNHDVQTADKVVELFTKTAHSQRGRGDSTNNSGKKRSLRERISGKDSSAKTGASADIIDLSARF